MNSPIHILENQQGALVQQQFLRRGTLITALQEAVDACLATGGGAIALVGKAGYGKSVLAHQFVCENTKAVYLDGLVDDGLQMATLGLSGIAVLDEAWQFEGVSEAMQKHVRFNRGVVVVLACLEAEARTLCDDLLKAVVQVPHWNGLRTVGYEIKSQYDDSRQALVTQVVNNNSEWRGIIRFRSPTGATWTGIGRTPNWLVALEAAGQLREQFRVNNTPLTRKKRSS